MNMNKKLINELTNDFDIFAATVNADTKVDCSGVEKNKLDAIAVATYLQMIDRIKMHKYPVNKAQAYDLYARMLNRAYRMERYGVN